MSLVSRVNAALAAVNVQFVRKTGLERLRSLQQEFQALLNDYQILKMRYERLSDRLHLSQPSPFQSSSDTVNLPDGASYLLIPSNTRLTDLGQRYRTINHAAMTSSLWSESFEQQEIDLYRFRARQSYNCPPTLNSDLHYALCSYYLKAIDSLGLLDRLSEDNWFGATTVQVNDRPISQELIDSLTEIYFLERHLHLSQQAQFNLLHIGAGYGRLAHRLAQALPQIKTIFCTDTIASFSFLCEYYLNFREVQSSAVTVPFDQLQSTLQHHSIQVAINTHSFSESPLEAIAAWLDLLVSFNIPYLMLVSPMLDQHHSPFLSYEKDKSRLDYQPLLKQRGYQQIACDPKFLDPVVQANGISPTHHFLFSRNKLSLCL